MTRNTDVQTVAQLLQEKNYNQLKQTLAATSAPDLAILLRECAEGQPESLPLLFRILPKELAAETFVEMDADNQQNLIGAFTDRELREVLEEMYVDDTVDLIEEMPANVVKRILKNTDRETRDSINLILQYGENTAGSVMTTEYVSLKSQMTTAEALERIRQTGIDKETIYTCYVLDGQRRLTGVVSARQLLLSNAQTQIDDIMEKNIISVPTSEDREVAAQLLARYGFLALPVVDGEFRMVGILTVDDAMTVMEEEATEDMEIMAAITPSEKPYLRTGILETWKQRIPWLMILMLSSSVTGAIIRGFEERLAAAVILTSFIPMLTDTGGNCGSQASVTIIRGLSVGDLRIRDLPRILWKEFRVSLLCGTALAAVNFMKMLLVDRLLFANPAVTISVALTVNLTLIATTILAKVIGSTLPLLVKKIGLDPTVTASPFITTVVDALSLLTYFLIAGMVLPQLR